MQPIEYDGNEIRLTFHQRAPASPRPPDGDGGWFLHAMSAQGQDVDGNGGVWLLWTRPKEPT